MPDTDPRQEIAICAALGAASGGASDDEIAAAVDRVLDRYDAAHPEQWPVETAARVCPVFKIIAGQGIA